jgi:nitroimidazol reductase NimA-like FMN-containing flavoprotein (pyridoxamine 5'-phosphate oxidase superfamily)
MNGVLTSTQINNILSSQLVGRLACTDGIRPYIVPVTFAYDGEYIYGQTNEGTKLKVLRKNPNVCFEVDKMIDLWNWQSVVIYGKFEELDNNEANHAREILLKRVFPLLTSSSIHAHQHEVNGTVDDSFRLKPILYRIRLTKVTGRFEQQ